LKPIFERVLTLIMAGGRGERLYPLTREVAKPAVTFGGIYKIIDFTLSNCFNSGIRQIYMLTQYSNVTMNRHVRLGWNALFRSELDEFIESIPPQHRSAEDWYRGTADSLYQNINLFERHKPDHVLILSGDHVYKMDYGKMIEYHEKMGAELTIAAVELDKSKASEMGVIGVDSDFRIKEFVEKPADPPTIPGDPSKSLVSMGIYVFDTKRLVRELIRDSKSENTSRDFGKNIIPSLVNSGSNVFAYPFRNENGNPRYWRDIGTLDSYYEANLDLIQANPEIDLYENNWAIRTFTGQNPPARTVDSTLDKAQRGVAIDSLISAGCVISGGKVERSVLSPEVRIHTGTEVSDCILMDKVDIGRRCIIRNAILCPGVHLPDNTKIGVDPEADRARFSVSPQGISVVQDGIVW
jgi:glucose-1-phosphate adenylyltransferase